MNDKLLEKIEKLKKITEGYINQNEATRKFGYLGSVTDPERMNDRIKEVLEILEEIRAFQLLHIATHPNKKKIEINNTTPKKEEIEYKQNPDNSREWIPKTEIKEVETEKEIGKSEFICPKCNKPITYISVTVGERVEQYIAYQDGNCKCVGPPPFSLEYINYIKRERIKNEEDKGGGNAS